MKKSTLIWLIIVLFIFCTGATAFAADPIATETPTPTSTATPTAVPTATPGILTINNRYIDENMASSWQAGYSPIIRNNTAVIVLPLDVKTSELALGTKELLTSINLGTNNDPFVAKNFDRSFPLNNGQCIITYEIPLTWPRTNGAFPVEITVQYRQIDGSIENQIFPISVIISDGPGPTPEPTIAPELPSGGGGGGTGVVSQPKVILSHYSVEPDPCFAGDVFTATATLSNTSKKTKIKNLTVTYKSQTTDLIPEDGTGTAYIEEIAPGDNANFNFRMQVRADAEAKPQKIDVAFSYEDSKATAYTGESEITVQVRQHIRLEYDPPKFPATSTIGESNQSTLNLYNKGKNILYNVNVVLEMPGITPEAAAFLGNMESGGNKTADIYYLVGPSPDDPEAEAVLGPVDGRFLVTYEDEYGESYELEIPVNTNIQDMPVMDPSMMDPSLAEGDMPTESGFQMPVWGWVVIGIIAAAVVAAIVAARKKAKREKQLLEEMDDDELS